MQHDDKDKRLEAGQIHSSESFAPSDHSRFIPGGYDELTPAAGEAPEEMCAGTPEAAEESSGEESSGDKTQEKTEIVPEIAPGNLIFTRLANICSWLMVPLLMPVYGIMLIFGLSILSVTSFGTKLSFTAIVFGINVLLPMIIILGLKFFGKIDDVGLNGRTERFIPYLACILAMGGTAWFMATKHAPMWVSMFFAGGALTGIVNLLVNFKWKISAHSAGIAGIVALLIRIARDGYPQGDVMLWILIAILLAGLTGTARLYLSRHTFWQVMAGYATGFCGVFFMTMIR